MGNRSGVVGPGGRRIWEQRHGRRRGDRLHTFRTGSSSPSWRGATAPGSHTLPASRVNSQHNSLLGIQPFALAPGGSAHRQMSPTVRKSQSHGCNQWRAAPFRPELHQRPGAQRYTPTPPADWRRSINALRDRIAWQRVKPFGGDAHAVEQQRRKIHRAFVLACVCRRRPARRTGRRRISNRETRSHSHDNDARSAGARCRPGGSKPAAFVVFFRFPCSVPP